MNTEYKEAVRRNFSKYAGHYDSHSSVQDFCASQLISKIGKKEFGKILDIGCGTGNYTRLLKDKFPRAEIIAVDISKEMTEVARKKFREKEIKFVIADGESIDTDEKFDLLTSNAAFQWFEDLEYALLRYKRVLRTGGVIAFTTFGPRTLCELNSSLEKLFNSGLRISSYNFAKRPYIEEILRRFFKKAEVDEIIYKEKYASVSDLLKKIKYSGARGVSVNNVGLWTPGLLADMEKVYKTMFGGITATYQIFLARGVKARGVK